jgi:hypothetical protein
MTGKGNLALGKAGLKPIYEGYFSKIFWRETNETLNFESGEHISEFMMHYQYTYQLSVMLQNQKSLKAQGTGSSLKES